MYIHVNLGNVFVYLVIYFMGEIPGSPPSKWKVMTWSTTMSCVPMFVHVHMCTCTLTHMYYSNAVYYTCILVQSTSIRWLSCFLYYSPLVLLSAHLLLFVVASQCKFQCFLWSLFLYHAPELFLCILYSEKLSREKGFMDFMVSEPSFFVCEIIVTHPLHLHVYDLFSIPWKFYLQTYSLSTSLQNFSSSKISHCMV